LDLDLPTLMFGTTVKPWPPPFALQQVTELSVATQSMPQPSYCVT
jgi:hypothetical protein